MLINSVSYDVALGYEAPEDPKKESVLYRTMVDGSISPIIYGGRQERISEFTLINITKANFVALNNYLISNAGEKILLTTENDGEKIFTEAVAGSTYYVDVLEPKTLQEEDYSNTDNLYTVTLRVSLMGTGASNVPNATSLIDVLIRIDTTMHDTFDSSEPTATYPGERWLDSDDNKLYKWDGSDWVYMYTVFADNPTYGFEEGSFWLSAFADQTDTIDTVSRDFISNWINYKSVVLPGQSIDISKGPAVARKEGWSFSIDNADKFWEVITSNNINLFGAKCSVWVYQNGETPTKLQSGFNRTNTFNYTSYRFKVEPFALTDNGVFPSDVIEDDLDSVSDRYHKINTNAVGDPVFATYGQHKYARLQNISTEPELIEFKDGTGVFAGPVQGVWNHVIEATIQAAPNNNVLELDVNKYFMPNNRFIDSKFTVQGLNAMATSGQLGLRIPYDQNVGSGNEDRVLKITSVLDISTAVSGNYEIILNDTLVASPGDKIIINIYKTSLRYQIDGADNVCGGFGQVLEDGTFGTNFQIWKISDDDRSIIPIPETEYSVISDGNKNIIVLNPAAAIDSNVVNTYKEIFVLSASDTEVKLPAIVFSLIGISIDDYVEATGIDLNYSGWPYSDPSNFKANHFLSRINTEIDWLYSLSSKTNFSSERIFEIQTNSSSGSSFRFGETNISAKAKFIKHRLAATTDDITDHGVLVARFPITPAGDVFDHINSDNVRLCIDGSISSYYDILLNGTAERRRVPVGIKIKIRAVKHDNSFLENDAWIHTVNTADMPLSTGISTVGREPATLFFNNFPGEDDGFAVEEPSFPSDNYKYIIVDISIGAPGGTHIFGDKYLNLSDTKIYTYDGSSWGSAVTPDNNDIILQQSHLGTTFTVLKYTSGVPPFTAPAIEGTDYNTVTTWKGRDLFDFSTLFESVNELWRDVKYIEVLFSCDNILDLQYMRASALMPMDTYSQEWFSYFNIRNISLFVFEETQVKEIPLLASVQGREISSSFTTGAEAITTDILNNIYPRKYNTEAVTSLFSGERGNWNFRRQFTTALSSFEILKELALNLWSAVIYNEEDEIVLKPLDDQSMESTSVTFTDADIITDSITEVQFRNSDQIYQKFKLFYDHNLASEISGAIAEFNNSMPIDKNFGPISSKRYLEMSEDLYNLNNTLEKKFKYHYESLPIADRLVKYFAFNTWKFKLKIKIENILGSNSKALVDAIDISSFFHTDDVSLFAFITKIKPLLYEGIAEIELYVIAPSGQLGPYCDPFNDALEVGVRDVSGWTDGNGKINDAGQVGVRTLGSIVKKDAGNVATRNFSCD